ncbi:hypothetical protein [Dyadobacter psychrotolerans]|uniref:Uncharacterized protein n=1 Tax=Dyadobacter psychrotolerans TaxID=2541721 RepID=A0A4R5D5P7_9BACT|nr:hypothetical protein [Dyadobacter psychrotolerans]TDE08676.1 hypothetical protein E0F88_32110 [Dyadobacter psychrotolerans]
MKVRIQGERENDYAILKFLRGDKVPEKPLSATKPAVEMQPQADVTEKRALIGDKKADRIPLKKLTDKRHPLFDNDDLELALFTSASKQIEEYNANN